MCVYNGARHLRAQLASIAAQDHPPTHMVVLDDGSTDGSWEILRDWVQGVPFPVRLERNETGLGVVRNFEKAARLVLDDVDVVFFCDQDDLWYPGKLAAFLDAFGADPQVGLVHSDADLVDGEGRPLGRGLFESLLVTPYERAEVVAGRAWGVYARRNLVTGAACACRSSVLARALPFSVRVLHDDWIAFTAALVSRVRMLDQPFLAYRLHQGNAVGLPVPSAAWRAGRVVDSLVQSRQGHHASRMQRLEEMRAHAEVLGLGPEGLAALDAALAHQRHRAALPRPFLARAVAVHAQWRRGAYARWSSGTLSMLHDLLNVR